MPEPTVWPPLEVVSTTASAWGAVVGFILPEPAVWPPSEEMIERSHAATVAPRTRATRSAAGFFMMIPCDGVGKT